MPAIILLKKQNLACLYYGLSGLRKSKIRVIGGIRGVFAFQSSKRLARMLSRRLESRLR
jgi:hypothetical protein